MTVEPTTPPRSGTDAPSVPLPRTPPDEPAARQPRRLPRWLRWLPHYRWSGTAAAVLLGGSSFTPSLLPRGWLLQGLIAGITAAVGYLLGIVVAWFVREVTDRRPSPLVRRRAWQVLGVFGAVYLLVLLWLGQRWQAHIHQLMGLKAPEGYQSAGIVVLGVLVFALLIGIGRLVRRVTAWLIRLGDRILPDRLARPLGVALSALLLLFLLNGVLFQGLVNAANSAFSVKDDGTETGAVAPTAPERSGSPASLVPWDELGLQGRNFVGTGPTAQQLTAFSGRPALEPIRAYAGLSSRAGETARADLAVRDLERAGGFGRKVLVVMTTTGTGWVDPAASDSLEYEFGGDTAMVAMQYSYLPSWISFLVDQSKARDAGRALFDAVYGRWSKLPLGQRPQLYAFGESLGTFGGEAAFSGLADITNRTNGVLWAGPPNFNELWRGIVTGRQSGSPEWLPVYGNGQTVRFANGPPDFEQPTGQWGAPRVAYLQHASDPIVWWSPQLILSRPDWLRGERGPDVSQNMVWIPFVTFWQVTADMVFAVDVPDGHGHHYAGDYVNGWADVAQPPGWTGADTDRLRSLIG